MIVLDMGQDAADGGGQHSRVVGVAEAGDEIRYDVEGQDEIGERAIEDGPRLERCVGINGAVIGSEKLVQEGNAAGVAAQTMRVICSSKPSASSVAL